MNSFDHYTYGAVGERMYENTTGIAAAEPATAAITVRPRPGGEMKRASGWGNAGVPPAAHATPI
ncbi:alpha-L-rhamnosidase [Thermomonospora echinospora]|uniref:Alpha-L-rhamnosidase n=2 Tax=Thermomonospora echinospora TaxID=1992 RepID=A0A1H6D4C5_9ACTN|nr:alpha-L-rhamnosidase [Thermomonospora echinospora]